MLDLFDSEDDYRTYCRNVSHCQQQSYSGLRSPGRSISTYFYLLLVTWFRRISTPATLRS